MNAPHDEFDAQSIRALLIELGERLADRGIEARVFLVGGAAMALAFSRKRVTRDLAAVFEPTSEIRAAAADMAEKHNLPSDWLNDGVKGLMPDRQQPIEGTATFSSRGIRVGVASAEYLFAMKAAAARQERDGGDLRHLADILGIENADQALELVDRFYGPNRLSVKTRLVLESLLGSGREPA